MKKEILSEKLWYLMNNNLSTFVPQFGDNNSIEINILVGKINEKKCSVHDKNAMMGRVINLINITK